MEKSKDHIAVLDFGSQYTHLIARRVRQLGVRSVIYPNNIKAFELQNVCGIILSGGPISVISEGSLDYDRQLFDLGVPILGICHGHQLIAKHFGGVVVSGSKREYGLATIEISNSQIFADIGNSTQVWMSHGDNVDVLPDGFNVIAKSSNDPISAMENIEKKIYSFQFHCEVHHSTQGNQMLSNFIFDICDAEKNWDTQTILQQIKQQIRKEAGQKKVFLLVSGGVDSTVCFCLLEKILGKENIYGLFVDHGFMRTNEGKNVKKQLQKSGFDNLHIYDAKKEFSDVLKNVSEPEVKRKIIGNLFIDIVNRVMEENKMDEEKWLLGQGTIYPDTIESGGTSNAKVIKTHHNRVDRIQEMIRQNKIIEPIKELYKDEVREIGKKLNLPAGALARHPFPGPGLAIRCLCSEKDVKGGVVEMDYNIDNCNLFKLPISSVGVQGDERSYSHPALIIKNDKQEKWDLLKKIAPEITNHYSDINRVLFLLDGDIEKMQSSMVTKSYLEERRINILRTIDYLVNSYIMESDRCKNIWQIPIVLVPFGYDKKESIVLRPVESEEAMTVSFAQIPKDILQKIVEDIKKLDLIDYIFYDITNKPPGTIEWE